MALSLQVTYPAVEGTEFDMEYYTGTHLKMVAEHLGAFIQSTLITKGLGGPGPGTPAPYYVLATMTFADKDNLDAALAAVGPVAADIPNFTNTTPNMTVGEVIG